MERACSNRKTLDAKQEESPFLYIKTDDDVFVEVYHLVKFLKAIFGDQGGPRKRSLVCDVVPSDAHPRGSGIVVKEDKTGMDEEYPEYCNGMAYLMTSDLIPEILTASNQVSLKILIK